MATCDHPSSLLDGLAFPNAQASRLRSSRVDSFPAEEQRDSPPTDPQPEQPDDIFYFIEHRPRNPWAAFGSVAVMSTLVMAAILIPLFHTGPLPKRERLTMLYLQPPAAAAGSAVKFQPAKLTPTYSSSSIPTPVVTKRQETPATPTASSGGVVGGVPGGVVGGIPGGVLGDVLSAQHSAPLPAKVPDAVPVKRIRVASRVVEANLIHDVTPQYPAEAGRDRIEGTVVLMAVIGTDGSVKDVRVESGLPVLAQAAIDAVKQWRYKPYTVDGQPVEVDSRITINFTLSS